MYIKNKYMSIVFKVMIVIIGIYGLYDSCFVSSIVSPSEHFSYYTNLSNLLCVIFYIFYITRMLIYWKKDKYDNYHTIKGAVAIAIIVTGIIYNFVLRPFMHDVDGIMDLHRFSNYVVHIIVPLMVVLDWLLFDKKGYFKKSDPFLWLILPFLYWIFTCIRAYVAKPFTYTESRYPYFFIDIDQFGIYQVIFNVVIVIIVILLLGFLYVFVDKKLANNKSI